MHLFLQLSGTKEAYEDLLKEARNYLNSTFGCPGQMSGEATYEELSLIDQMSRLLRSVKEGDCIVESANFSLRPTTSASSADIVIASYAASAAASVPSGPRASQVEKNNKQKMAKTLHHVSEVLHYASIAILSLFVLEVFAKVLCLGKTFFKEKFEVSALRVNLRVVLCSLLISTKNDIVLI